MWNKTTPNSEGSKRINFTLNRIRCDSTDFALWVTGRKTAKYLQGRRRCCVSEKARELQIGIGITVFCPRFLCRQQNTNSLDVEERWKTGEEGKTEFLASSSHYKPITQHFCVSVKTSNELRFTTPHKRTICRPPSESVWVRLGLDSMVCLICALWKQNSPGPLHGSPSWLTNPEIRHTYLCSCNRSSPLW